MDGEEAAIEGELVDAVNGAFPGSVYNKTFMRMTATSRAKRRISERRSIKRIRNDAKVNLNLIGLLIANVIDYYFAFRSPGF